MNESAILRQLLGTWHIQFTNFPMWLSGDKRHPTLTYAQSRRSDTLVDIVTYQHRGREKKIRGTDRHLGGCTFRWKGAGLLSLLTSNWKVAYLSPECDWAIICFEKSLFSPAGHDIIARREVIPEDPENRMAAQFQSLFPDDRIERLGS